jgi:dihydroflavonol-4-reductase
VQKTTGKAAPSFTCPLWLASAAAPFMAAIEHRRGRRPLYTKASIVAINSNRTISHEKAERELGYHPRPLEQTICDTLAWLVDYGRIPGKSE